MATAAFCLATSEEQTLTIVNLLREAGFSNNDISVLLPDKSGTRDFAHEQHTKAPDGATAGALAIPGLGPFIAAGPIMAALSGAALGAAVGGLTGALIGMGIPEFEAKRYEGKLKQGNILISVHSENSAETGRATDIFRKAGAIDINTASETKVPAPSESKVTIPSKTGRSPVM
jgi:uncharacterized membrane protein